ncbi:MAG: hypothetical protein AAGA77_07050, partial [Bacteroidota bacterium]
DINVAWVKGIEYSEDFSLSAPISKDDVCNYIYPMMNNVTDFFQVIPSEEVLELIDKNTFAEQALGIEDLEDLCES